MYHSVICNGYWNSYWILAKGLLYTALFDVTFNLHEDFQIGGWLW